MDAGIVQASRVLPTNPLPVSWLGRPDAPIACPDWAVIPVLTATQQRNLLAQIAYDFSGWDYKKIGANNELGRYQFNVQTLESYGLLTPDSYISYGIDAVNYQHCWRAPFSTYADYLSEVTNINDFLTNTSAQELLAYQRLLDLYNSSLKVGTIRKNDTADVVVGMLYTAWVLSPGTAPTKNNTTGTGAYAWRNHNIGTGNVVYTSGRYSATVLSTSSANNVLPTYADQQSATVAETAGTVNSGGSDATYVWTQLPNGAIYPGNQLTSIKDAAGRTLADRGAVLVYRTDPYPNMSAESAVASSIARQKIFEGIAKNAQGFIQTLGPPLENPSTAYNPANMAAIYATQQIQKGIAEGWIKDQIDNPPAELYNNKIQQYAIDKLDILNALNLTAGEFTGNV